MDEWMTRDCENWVKLPGGYQTWDGGGNSAIENEPRDLLKPIKRHNGITINDGYFFSFVTLQLNWDTGRAEGKKCNSTDKWKNGMWDGK